MTSIKTPLWHRLLLPYWNWRRDHKEKRDAAKALREWRTVGYFRFYGRTIFTRDGSRGEEVVVVAMENGLGKRKVEYCGPSHWRSMALEQAAVNLWLTGHVPQDGSIWRAMS